jgi:aryl-alcohol dehydrogenase-like predicted oxidoreductase
MMARTLGKTGIEVSVVGFGAAPLGDASLSDRDAETLLFGALDEGVTLLDTARSYGCSEERLGRVLGRRRSEVVLSTKGGYGVDGVADWTGEAVARGIDGALSRMRVRTIDVFHLHSCDAHTLARDDILEALVRAKQAGKVRAVAYSGENEALERALCMGAFDSVQCSVNVFDQRALASVLSEPRLGGAGVLAKRPLANAPWRFAEQPRGDYAEAYWLRMRAMGVNPLELAGLGWAELAMRFAAHAAGVTSVLVGTRSLEHLRANVAAAEKGPLAPEVVLELGRTFAAHDVGWAGQI